MSETAGVEDTVPMEVPNEVPIESLETAAELTKTEDNIAPDELTKAPPEQSTESNTKDEKEAGKDDSVDDVKEPSPTEEQNGVEVKNGDTTNETPKEPETEVTVPLPVENAFEAATREIEEAVTVHADKIIAETQDQDLHQESEGTKNENEAGESTTGTADPNTKQDEAAAKPSAAAAGNQGHAKEEEGKKSGHEAGKPDAGTNDKPNEDAAKTSEDSKPTEEDTKPAADEGTQAGSQSRGKVLRLPESETDEPKSDEPKTDELKIDDSRPVHIKRGEVLKRPQDVTSVVTRNGKTWNEMFNILEEYKKTHGDTYVPDRYKWDGVCLGLWVRNQRRREASLTEEQHKRLTDLGLDWQTQNERFDNVWHERYAKLTEYRCENGDCKVPYTYKKDPALAKWVSQQRAQQAQGRLAADRKAKLDAIDFSWKLNTVKNRNTKTEDKKWQKQFDKLQAFRQEHGHCKVPDRYKPDRPLGTWVKKQRLANACNQLKEDRKKMLDDIGFVWRITDKTDGEKWDRMFDQLKTYKSENGTCHVSRTVPDSDLKPLARWVKTQRALYKSGKILDDRKERLESINFVWDGTQLPIKRKRRRQSEEGGSKENGEPKAKVAKTDDASTEDEGDENLHVKSEKKEDDDEKKVAPQQPALKPEGESAPVIVDKAKVVDSDSKPKASEEVGEKIKEAGNGEETANVAKEAPPTNESSSKDKESTIETADKQNDTSSPANPSTSNEDNGPAVASKTNGELIDNASATEATQPTEKVPESGAGDNTVEEKQSKDLIAIAEGILADNPVIEPDKEGVIADNPVIETDKEGVIADNPAAEEGKEEPGETSSPARVVEEGKEEPSEASSPAKVVEESNEEPSEASSPAKGETPTQSDQPEARSTRSKRELPAADQTAQVTGSPAEESIEELRSRRKKPRIKYSA